MNFQRDFHYPVGNQKESKMKKVKVFPVESIYEGIAKVYLQGMYALPHPKSGLIPVENNKFLVGTHPDLEVYLHGFDLETITVEELMKNHQVSITTDGDKTKVEIHKKNIRGKQEHMLYIGTVDDGTFPVLDYLYEDIREIPDGNDKEFCFITLAVND
jgi:hypothetical protein